MIRKNLIINLTGTFLSSHKASHEIKDIIYKQTSINSRFLLLNNNNLQKYLEDDILMDLNKNKCIITYSGVATKSYLHTFHNNIRWYSNELYSPICLQVINNLSNEITKIPTSYQIYNDQVTMVYLLNKNMSYKEDIISHILEK